MNDRAVVLCRTAAGLRAATWLAWQGVAVRVLCRTDHVPADPIDWVGGPRDRVQTLVGPVEEAATPDMWFGGASHSLPARKRDLATVASGSAASAGRELLLGRLGGGGTAEAWVRRWLGASAWTQGLHAWLDHRLAGPSARAPAGVARRLLGSATPDGWWRPTWSAEERARRQVGAILDAGGEVLTSVDIQGLEVEHGRIVGVHTEFGFDPVDDRLFTDLPPDELAPLLDEDLVVPRPPLGDRVHVLLEGRLDKALWIADDARRVLQLTPCDGAVRVEIVLASSDPLHGADDEQLGQTIAARVEGLVDVGGVVGVARHVRRVACPRPSIEAPWEELGLRYAALGVQPVGETGWLLPVGLLDELDHLEQAAAGTVVRTQREAWLADGPPGEPWTPWRPM